ncbi:MAG: sodium-dependent transporter [Planctomycetia bacterium]|nr:sodium-dependent transporter [Planctomycetia bacterium]
MKNDSTTREHWGGSLGFVLAAAGSAIGLGNIWKFPYITGMNGGGAFVLVYLFCIILIGLPIMICEITLGRKTQKNPLGAFLAIAPHGTSTTRSIGSVFLLIALGLLCFGKFGLGLIFGVLAAFAFYFGWGSIGLVGVLTPFVIMSYYGTVGGWTFAYFIKGITQQLNISSTVEAQNIFNSFALNPFVAVFYQLMFTLLCGFVVWFGIKNGIELASKFLLPLLLLLLILLIMRSLTLPGAAAGVRFLLSPDFGKLTSEGVLIALGHAFFSLSLGMGAMLTYGSYLDSSKNIYIASLNIVFLDTLIALMAGLAIFPAVFAMQMNPEAGPGLVFQIMPVTFNAIGDNVGWLWSSLFFLLLFIAALTSGISLLEVCISCLIDEFHFKRHSAVFGVTLLVSIMGVLSTISVFDWEKIPWLEKIFLFLFNSTDASFFDAADNFSCNYLLPLGGLGISLFVGWVWGTRYAIDEIRKGGEQFSDVNFFTLLAGLKDDPNATRDSHSLTLGVILGIFIRFLSPICIIITFLHSIGWLKF